MFRKCTTKMVRDALREARHNTFDELSEEDFKKLRLVEDMGLDSFDREEIAFYLESDHGFSFNYLTLNACRTVGDIMNAAKI